METCRLPAKSRFSEPCAAQVLPIKALAHDYHEDASRNTAHLRGRLVLRCKRALRCVSSLSVSLASKVRT